MDGVAAGEDMERGMGRQLGRSHTSDHEHAEEAITWVMFCFVLCTTSGLCALFWVFRKTRFIAIRDVQHSVEFGLALGALLATVAANMVHYPFISCNASLLLMQLSACKCWIPFLITYRHFFLRYQVGSVKAKVAGRPNATESAASEQRPVGSDIPRAHRPKESARAFLVRQTLRFSVHWRYFVFFARGVEGLALVVILVGFFLEPYDGEKSCFASSTFILPSIVNVSFGAFSLIIGFGILVEFAEVAKEGDRLGIKRMVLRCAKLNVAVLNLLGISSGLFFLELIHAKMVMIPVLLESFLLYEYFVYPLYVLSTRREFRRQANTGKTESSSQVELMEQFAKSSEGYGLLEKFLLSELCVESLYFIIEASSFHETFAENQPKKPAQSPINRQLTMATAVFTGGPQRDETLETQAAAVYQRFIHPDAPYLINAEHALLEQVRKVFEARALVAQDSDRNVAQGGPGKYSPSVTPVGSAERGTSALSILRRQLHTSGPMASVAITPELFERLRKEQVELLYMDVFHRFLSVDPQNQQAWEEFVGEHAEMQLLTSEIPSTKDDTPGRVHPMPLGITEEEVEEEEDEK